VADIIIDLYDETKDYVKLVYQKGRDVPSDEFNEMMDVERVLRRRAQRGLWGDGFFTTGFAIIASVNPNEIIINIGGALIQGEYSENRSNLPIQGLTTPGAPRVDIVYARFREIEITSIDDPAIEFSDIGETARRLKLEWDVFVDEGSTTLPLTTGDIHAGGIHYELIGFLNRPAATPVVPAAQIQDARRILGFSSLTEDKNLEFVGGGDVTYNQGTGAVSFTAEMRIIQPSTNGHAIIPITQSPFNLTLPGQVAYVILDRNASLDYNVPILIGSWNTIPNNTNAFPLFYRNTDNQLYAVEGTVWAGIMTHPLRQNPFTGLIVDADVDAVADIQGTKLLDFSVPLTKLVSIPEGVPVGGIILWKNSNTCPSGFTNLEVGANDTFLRLMGSGGSPIIVPFGSNTHNFGSHAHSFSVNTGVATGFTVGPVSFSNLGVGSASEVGHGHGPGTVQYFGGTGGATVLGYHEPKAIQLLMCVKS
jgi:hypothetical protein